MNCIVHSKLNRPWYSQVSVSRLLGGWNRVCVSALALSFFVSVYAVDQTWADIVYDNLDAIRDAGNDYGIGGEGREDPAKEDDFLGQQFLLGANNTVSSITLLLDRIEMPSGPFEVQIWDDDGSGLPGTPVGTIGFIDDDIIESLCGCFQGTKVTLDTPVIGLNPNSPYYVVISFEDTISADQGQLAWKTVASSDGTNGASRAMANGENPFGLPADWLIITDHVNIPQLNYYQMSVTASSPVAVNGDFNQDGVLDAADIDVLTTAVIGGINPPSFDLNGDQFVDQKDRRVWVSDLKKTWFGDSNLDGQFQTTDFIKVFTAGEYEDELKGNSTWFTGDWNGDREFDSGDMVTAFQDGGWESGPRVAVSVVPEPSCLILATLGIVPFVGAGLRRRGLQGNRIGILPNPVLKRTPRGQRRS